MTDLRVAAVGCGPHSTRRIYPQLSKIIDIDLVALCDRNLEKATRFSKKFGFERWYTDHQCMIKKEALDAVLIIGPPAMHFSVAMDCLEAGIHVFVEKPIAPTAEQCLELAEKASERNCSGQVGHFLRHSAGNLLAKSILMSEDFGDPITFDGYYHTNGPWEPRKQWGLESIFETYMLVQGIHLLDLAHFISGDILEMSAHKSLTAEGRPVLSGSVRFANGSIGSLSFNASAPNWSAGFKVVSNKLNVLIVENGMNVRYEKMDGWGASYRDSDSTMALVSENGSGYNNTDGFGYLGELKSFFDSVRNNAVASPTFFDSYKSMKDAQRLLSVAST